nr:hypothetical protein [Tanacetum cinerariifolium]
MARLRLGFEVAEREVGHLRKQVEELKVEAGKVSGLMASYSQKEIDLSTLNGKYQDLLWKKEQLELHNASLWAALDARLDKIVKETDEEFAPILRDVRETKNFLVVKGFCYFLNKFKKIELLNTLLGTCISAAILDGMRQGLDVGFVRRKKGTDINSIFAYNPDATKVYADVLNALNNVSFPLLENIKFCAELPFSYLIDLLVMGVHKSIQDEAETSTNLASGSTSSAGGVAKQFIIAPSVPYAGVLVQLSKM